MESDAVFKALGDPSRRRLLDMLHERSGLTLGELCEGLQMRRQSVSQHLELLEGANLVTSIREGRRKLHHLNAVPLHEVQRRWIWKFEEQRLDALDDVKRRAEESAMTTTTEPGAVPDYVYTTYIRATPDQVWDALTDADVTRRFWGHAQVSSWTVGSRVEHVRTDGSGIADAAGTVLEVDRPYRLSFTFDDAQRVDDPTSEPTVVTFVIDSDEDVVKLVLTHSRLPSSGDLRTVGDGWPAVLANLKTLLETGAVLPQAPWEFHADERAAQMAQND